MTIVYKMLNENEPQYLADTFSFKNFDTTRSNKSNSKQLEVPFNRKRIQGDRGFSFIRPNYWNPLPNYIKEAENLGKFKKLLKMHFLDYPLINFFKLKNTHITSVLSYTCIP